MTVPRVVVLVLVAAAEALGHGAMYQAPAGGPSRTGGVGVASSTTLAGSAPGAVTIDRWEYWWEYNKDRLLQREQKRSVTSSLGLRALAPTRRTERVAADPRVITVLFEILDATPPEQPDILDSVILALARSVDAEQRPRVLAGAQALLEHDSPSVRASATLALGVAGDPAARLTLRGRLTDDTDALVRTFAGIALGMLDQPDTVDALLAALDGNDMAARNGAVVGLGLMSLPSAQHAVPVLVRHLRDGDWPGTSALLPITLGRLGDRAALPALVAVLGSESRPATDRQSAALALGDLALCSDDEALTALIAVVDDANDPLLRHLALIALARIGAADADTTSPGQKAVRELLIEELTRPSVRSHQPWAALAAMLYARGRPEVQPAVIDRLLRAARRTRDDSHKAACTLSLALLGDRSSAASLHRDFRNSKDPAFRGYASLALGLMNEREAIDDMEAALRDESTAPTFRHQAAVSLGRLDPARAVAVLLDVLRATGDDEVKAAVASALGLIGHRAAIAPLLLLAGDPARPDSTRAFAIVALGLIEERTDLPWYVPLSEGHNFGLRIAALDEILNIL